MASGEECYRMDAKQVLSSLGSGPSGLSVQEVEGRLGSYGRNIIELRGRASFLSLLASQFKSYMAWLLISVSSFALFSGFWFHKSEQLANGVIIGFIVFVNAFVGAYQDYKSERSAELLRSMLKDRAVVVRKGEKSSIDASGLVPGDVILLAEGDKIPADCRLIESEELRVDESILTGESGSVLKSVVVIRRGAPLAERSNCVFMDTFVVKGAAKAVVFATGRSTEVGRIARSLEAGPKSSFMDEVDFASKRITYVALAMILAVSLIFLVQGHDWVSVFMIGSALIIGSIPEGLPAIVTFSLSMASVRLAKNGVLIKRKTLLETLGSVDIVCSDKTGTLTENRMVVKRLFFEGKISLSFESLSVGTAAQFSRCALLCNEAKDTDKGFIGDAEDIALIDFLRARRMDIRKFRASFPMVSFEPFSSDAKFAMSHNKVGKDVVGYRKGAPEVIIARCGFMLKSGKIVKFKDKSAVLKVVRDFSGDALRNIAFSFSQGRREVFIGFVGMYDRPKDGIDHSVKALYSAGIDVKMITGDDALTACAVAKECGFRGVSAVSWHDLKELPPGKFREKVLSCNVFARMSPDFKYRIVSVLQEAGHRVAITGDGVNDVPALKKADVGIAMGKRGADIAKEAADLILLQDDLPALLDGIREGRTVFSNIRKVINYLLTANLSEVLVVFASSLIGLMPFLPLQLLWVNFVTDVAPAMALGVDPAHKDIMAKRPTGKAERLINRRISLLTVFVGLRKFIFMFLLFLLAYHFTGDLLYAQTISFTWLVLSHFIRIASIRFDERVPFFCNKALNWALAVPILLQLAILYTPLRGVFQVEPLSFVSWALICLAVALAVYSARLATRRVDKMVPWTDRDY